MCHRLTEKYTYEQIIQVIIKSRLHGEAGIRFAERRRKH
jgi:hypothetical protein